MKTILDTTDPRSRTEIRIGHRYSVRELGKSQWVAVDSLAVAIAARKDARIRAGMDCVVVDNRTGEIVA